MTGREGGGGGGGGGRGRKREGEREEGRGKERKREEGVLTFLMCAHERERRTPASGWRSVCYILLPFEFRISSTPAYERERGRPAVGGVGWVGMGWDGFGRDRLGMAGRRRQRGGHSLCGRPAPVSRRRRRTPHAARRTASPTPLLLPPYPPDALLLLLLLLAGGGWWWRRQGVVAVRRPSRPSC